MNLVFADAGYWIALFNPRDQLHSKALSISTTLQGRRILTSQMVLTEFLNHYASLGRPFRHHAAEVIRSLQEGTDVEVVPQTDAQFQAALRPYAQRPDKEWGLTDCASFLLMRERGVKEAMAHDDRFHQAGFIPLLRDN